MLRTLSSVFSALLLGTLAFPAAARAAGADYTFRTVDVPGANLEIEETLMNDSGLIVQNNSTDNLPVSSNGIFNFATPQPTGSNYSVTILMQPANETCAVTNGSGTIVGANITDVLITCTGEWTWVGGSNTDGVQGSYGIEGTPSALNMPGARFEAATFTDAAGRFWLFGGYGLDSAASPGDLNDLWSYDPGAGAWTRISG